MVAAGAPPTSPMKKPPGSTRAKQASSPRPGFQPSAAAQSTAIEISSDRIVRTRNPLLLQLWPCPIAGNGSIQAMLPVHRLVLCSKVDVEHHTKRTVDPGLPA